MTPPFMGTAPARPCLGEGDLLLPPSPDFFTGSMEILDNL
jgi:hypothetical protein